MDDRLKQFRVWDALDGRREIFCPEDSLPEDDLVFFLLELIPGLDLSAFHEFYSKDLRGQPPFHVALRTVLLVYSYSVGVFSSRKMALACERHLAFLAIVGNDRPDFRPCLLVTNGAATSARTIRRRGSRCSWRSCAWRVSWGWSGSGISRPTARRSKLFRKTPRGTRR